MKNKFITLLKKKWKEWRSTVLFVVFVIIPIKSSVAELNWVPTGSMNPTILEGDLVYVNKLAYDLRIPLTQTSLKHFSDPQRGDIAVLFSPEDETRLVKRVIGTPGDSLEMKQNVLYINDTKLEYRELSEDSTKGLMQQLKNIALFAEEDLLGCKHSVMSIPRVHNDHRSFEKLVVPEGYYFVMGDNRDNSKDSRSFGFAERKLFIGEATNVVASFNKLDKYQPRFERFFTPLD